MIEFVLSSHNEHKCQEIQAMLKGIARISNLDQYNITDNIPETGTTFEENALQKAEYVYTRLGKNCFADDSGLMVDVLNGAPGVWSARYAGEPSNNERNIDLLLKNLEGAKDRTARFVTVIAAIIDGKHYFFKGEVKGQIITERHGTGGFGYDPIFVPDGYNQTFGELSAETKNGISHRANAIKKFAEFLSSIKQ